MKRPTRLIRIMVGVAVTLSVAAYGFSTASGAATKKPIIIAMPVALTGALSSFDTPTLQGAELAVAAVNKAGGVLGRPFKIIYQDTKSDIPQVAAIAQQLLAQGAN